MTDTSREARTHQIANAAYALLEERGYGGMSMLAVAKRARASNETLYRWFGDKTGLFRALIEINARSVTERLDNAPGDDPREALAALGPILLGLLLGDRAVALNRAAAADPTGSLGAVLAEAGRATVLPRIAGLFSALAGQGACAWPPEAAAALYVDLLAGDWQVRRVTGAMARPSEEEQAARAQRALALCLSIIAEPPPLAAPLVPRDGCINKD